MYYTLKTKKGEDYDAPSGVAVSVTLFQKAKF
jgi:hypothetical protein